jgi:AraC-like DNA-binding protein
LTIETPGALIIEVDIAVDRTPLDGLFDNTGIIAWESDAVLPSATGAALRELLKHPFSPTDDLTDYIRTVEQLVVAAATCPVETRADDGSIHGERNRIIDYVTKHRDEQNLTPTTVAKAFGMSKRKLHRLFEHEDRSLGEWISSARLSGALDRLRDPVFAGKSIEDVAIMCGYGSSVGFRRAIYAETGMTPKEVRAQAASLWIEDGADSEQAAGSVT